MRFQHVDLPATPLTPSLISHHRHTHTHTHTHVFTLPFSPQQTHTHTTSSPTPTRTCAFKPHPYFLHTPQLPLNIFTSPHVRLHNPNHTPSFCTRHTFLGTFSLSLTYTSTIKTTPPLSAHATPSNIPTLTHMFTMAVY